MRAGACAHSRHVAIRSDDHRRHAVRHVARGGDRVLILPRDTDAVRGHDLLGVEGRISDRCAGVSRFRPRLRRRIRLRVRLRPLADPVRRASRLHPVRLLPDRLRCRGSRHRIRRPRQVGLTGRNAPWIGPVCSVLGVLGFSFKAILIKLAYALYPVDPVTLIALRMLFAAPFFIAMAWWAGRQPNARPIAASDWRMLVWLGFIGYYLGSLLDFVGLMYITA